MRTADQIEEVYPTKLSDLIDAKKPVLVSSAWLADIFSPLFPNEKPLNREGVTRVVDGPDGGMEFWRAQP